MAENDAWRAYVELVLGLTETSRKKAMKIVQQVAGKGGATADQLQDLIGQGMANREALTRMIKVELDRALGRVGLATMEEVEELTRRVRDLERELQETRTGDGNHSAPASAAADGPEPAAAATPAKKTVAKKTAAKKAPGTATAKATGTAATAQKSTAAKKTATKATASKAATARKAPAKKTATGTGR